MEKYPAHPNSRGRRSERPKTTKKNCLTRDLHRTGGKDGKGSKQPLVSFLALSKGKRKKGNRGIRKSEGKKMLYGEREGRDIHDENRKKNWVSDHYAEKKKRKGLEKRRL